MPLCKSPQKFKKKLEVSLNIDSKNFKVNKKREKITQTKSLEVSFDTKIPDPIVFQPLTPTNENIQRIRGLRPSEQFLVQINGSGNEVRYSGKEFSKVVELHEGINRYEIRLISNSEKGNSVSIEIEKNTTAPTTQILGNGLIVNNEIISNKPYDITFKPNEKNCTTYFSINDENVQVYSEAIFLGEEKVYNFEFWSIDFLNNKELPHNFASITIDRSPPERPEIDLNNLPPKTKHTSLLVTGTASLDTESIEVNGISGNVNIPSWDAIISLPIEGINIITAIAIDTAGNKSDPGIASIIRDTIPPEQPKLITNTIKTRAEKLRIIGSQSFDTFSMLINGEPDIELTSPVRWLAEIELSEGPNIYTVVALDDVGNQSSPLIFTITKDTIPPPPPIVDLVLSPTNNAIQLITGTTSLDTAKIVINFNSNIARVNSDGTWVALLELEHENLNELNIQAEDDIGNISVPTTVGILLDRISPHAPTIDSLPLFTNQGSILVQGDKTTDSVEVLFNDSSTNVSYPAPNRWSKLTNLIPGKNEFDVQAKDFVGNISEANKAFVFYKPNPPIFTIDPFLGHTFLSSTLITGKRDSGSAIFVNDGPIGISYPDGSDGLLWNSLVNLNIGNNHFTYKAYDAAGNISAGQEIDIERIAPVTLAMFPVKTVYAFQNKNSVTINGENAPIIASNDIKSYFIVGQKPAGINIISNFGTIIMPNGLAGSVWEMIVPVKELKKNVLRIILDGINVLSPPEINISNILIVKNIFAGQLEILISGITKTVLKQNASIVLTDFQFNNTPSPIEGTKLNELLVITQAIVA